jgi:isoquinoline 1-oxidoreductase alpha subunit
MAFAIKVNGNAHNVDVDGDTPLLRVLRDVLGMTGTKFGCGMAFCGACTVHIDGVATRSCTTTTTVDSIGKSQITTIEANTGDWVRVAILQRSLRQPASACECCRSAQRH